MRAILALLFVLVGGSAWGQCTNTNGTLNDITKCPGSGGNPAFYDSIYVNPSNPIQGNGSVLTGLPPTVEKYGARGDGVTNDTAAFNAYASALRVAGAGTFNLTSGKTYYIATSVNLTATSNIDFDGHGATITGGMANYPILDATESSYSNYHDFIISPTGGAIGLRFARAINVNFGASSNSVSNVFMDGIFSIAPIYNRGAESTSFFNVYANNRYSGANGYAYIADGDAHWQIQSLYAGTYNPGCSPSTSASCQDALYPYAPVSFNENLFFGGTLGNYYGPAIWMANTRGNQFIGTYVAASSPAVGGAPGPAIVLYYHSGDTINNLTYDVHSEPTSLTSDVLVTGTQTAPIINGMTYRNHFEETADSVFALGGSATSGVIHNLVFSVPQVTNIYTLAFDNGSDWTADGYAYLGQLGLWNGPTQNMTLNTLGTVTFGGTLGASATLPAVAGLNGINSGVGVASVTISTSACYYMTGGGSNLPAIVIPPPAAGGTQAIAPTSAVGVGVACGANVTSGGTGFSNTGHASILGGTCSVQPQISYTASDGVVQSVSGYNAGVCTVTPADPVSTADQSGSGTDLVVNHLGWGPNIGTITTTSPGSGYSGTVVPSLSQTNGAVFFVGAPVLSATLNTGGSFTLSAGGVSALNVSSEGTSLGSASGQPVTLSATGFTTAYGVSAVDILSGACYFVTAGGANFPSINIPSPATGTQATAFVTSMGVACAATINTAGTGYPSSGNASINGGTCSPPPQISYTASGGVVQTVSGSSLGNCSVLPADPVSTTDLTGSGTGLTVKLIGWGPATGSINTTNEGIGYTATPPVPTLNATSQAVYYTGTPSLASTTAPLPMALTGGASTLTLNNTGAQLTNTPAFAGSGGLYLCQDTSGNLYRKSSCP